MLAWARRIVASCTACGMGRATDVPPPPPAGTARCTGDVARAMVWRLPTCEDGAPTCEDGAPTCEDGAPTCEDSVGEGFPLSNAPPAPAVDWPAATALEGKAPSRAACATASPLNIAALVGAADDGRRVTGPWLLLSRTGRWLLSRVGEVGCCASRCCRRCSCHSRRCWRVWSC